MTSTDSLTARLRLYADTVPNLVACTFLPDGEGEETNWTFGALDRAARAAALQLLSVARPGGRVLLVHPMGPEFFVAFLGCLYAGLIAVPAPLPRANQTLDSLDALARDCGATVAATTADVLRRLTRKLDAAPYLSRIHWIAEWLVSRETLDHESGESPDANSLAYLQYTSGSTGEPAGVMISHPNLTYNLQMIESATADTGTPPVFLSWLPLFHDLGLVGTLASLYRGGRCVLLPPLHVIQKPIRWLRAIDRYRATVSGGPNFIYDLCVEKIPAADRSSLDLSSWHAAFVAAEPVRAQTLERFAGAFTVSGFRMQAFRPSYGLAEATVLVTTDDVTTAPLVCRFSETDLERGRAVPLASSVEGRALVGCGHPWLGQEIAIVDPESHRRVPPQQVGEIWVSGNGVARGYWNRPIDTARTFGATLDGAEAGAFLRTGDLGFVHDGQLFVAGRLKDLIIIRGSNYHPQDIESTVERAHGALARHGAAFSVDLADEERLIVVHELVRHAPPAVGPDIISAVRRAVVEEHGIRPHAVILLKSGAAPRTTSGKIRRRSCRDQLMEELLDVAVADYGDPDCRRAR